MSQIDQPLRVWGDRWSLLDKRIQYAFSLCADFELHDWDGETARLRMSVAAPAPELGSSLFHVFEERVSPTADGSLHEIPQASLVSGSQWLDVRRGADASLHGYLVLETALRDPLTIEYRGVAAVRGGFARVLQRAQATGASAQGTSFVSTRHECSHPKYRWLVLQQLIGFGELTVSPGAAADSFHFSFRYDLYSGLAAG
jgi:hypothetical protein